MAPLRTARLASVSLRVNMPAKTNAAYGAAHRELEPACWFHHALAPDLLLPSALFAHSYDNSIQPLKMS